ncbi:MAG: tRNA lysidine(34) synthetase TilS [Bryobacteraceae bacterium]
MFRPGDRVGVAVSGGADSLCLLEVLRRLAPRWNLALTVLHFDHRLRGEESRLDAEFVEELARRHKLPFRAGWADVAAIAQRERENLEEAARRARREFFLGLLISGELDRVALGHTRSDQAETVLFRLLRGAGTTGLAAIRPVTAEGFVRPLIEVSREEIERFLSAEGIAWRLDHTNLDLRLARNRLRHELIPLLRRQWNPAIEKVLAQTALLAQEDEEYWESETTRLAGELFRKRAGGVELRATALCSLPKAAARRLVRRAVAEAAGALWGWEFHHVEAILRLAQSAAGSGCVAGPGLEVRRSFDWLRFAQPDREAPCEEYRLRVEAPGVYRVAGGDWTIRLSVGSAGQNQPAGPRADRLDPARLPGPLELRNWMPGDRYRPAGRAKNLKVKELFQEARIPLWERKKWPIMTSGEQIVWTPFGAAAEYAAPEGCPGVLLVEAVACDECPGARGGPASV